MVALSFLLHSLIWISVQSISLNLIPKTGTPPSYREQPALAFNSYENKFYAFGGNYIYPKDDMWEFDLGSRTWSEIHFTSPLNPQSRYQSTLIFLEDSRKLLLFGGATNHGPVSDLWLFDIEHQNVRYK
jgi:hypothetical protein